jgi:ABC-type amino acid transport substrate-binding protein
MGSFWNCELTMRVFWIIVACLGLVSFRTAAEETIVYPLPSIANDKRYTFPEALLSLILSKSPNKYKEAPIALSAQQRRILKHVEDGKIDLFWAAAQALPENDNLLVLRIPIFKGLLGYRLILTNDENLQALKRVKSLEDLSAFSIGHGSDWPEVLMYKDLGFNVVTTTDYNALFKMLTHGRFDLFPRSVIEVWAEMSSHSELDLKLDRHLLLHYPHALYFYVNGQKKSLFDDVERGFKEIIDSGEYDALLKKFHGQDIEKVKISKRHLINIPNPQFGKISVEDAKYFFIAQD